MVWNLLKDFVDRYDRNRYIASCRTAAYRYNFKQAGTATLCWELLKRDQNKAAKELAHSPILLTFLCLTYDKSQTFANNRSGLYKKALRILLEEWAAEKRIMRQAIYEGLSVELEEVLLSEIACEGFAEDRLFIPQSQLVDRIKKFLSSNLNAPKQLSGEQVLEAIAIQQGILVERVEDVYSFSHLTLQEYLTARYIYAHGQIPQMVEKYLSDDRWREVFLLTSGLMVDRGSDELLLEMHKAAKQYARHPKVKALLQWADQVTAGSSGNFKPAAKRAVAIASTSNIATSSFNTTHSAKSIAISINSAINSAIYNDIDIIIYFTFFSRSKNSESEIFFMLRRGFNNIPNFGNPEDIEIKSVKIKIDINEAKFIADRLDQSGIFTELKLSQLAHQLQNSLSALKVIDIPQAKQIFQQIISVYLEVFQLTEELITYNSEESEALENYLYSVDLLLKCKQEAARLSPTKWKEIESELLLPPDD